VGRRADFTPQQFTNDTIDEVVGAMAAHGTVARACNAAASVLHARTGAAVDILLLGPGYLSLVAFSGAWQGPASVPTYYGVVGHVLASGRPAAIYDASIGYAGIHARRPVGSVLCAPISDPPNLPVGVVNMEFDQRLHDPARWASSAAAIGGHIKRRIDEIGGVPAQSPAELMLRHALAFATARDGVQLADMACRAAVEVLGLGSAMVFTRKAGHNGAKRRPFKLVASHVAPGSTDLPAQIATLPTEVLSETVQASSRNGPSHTLGDPASKDARGFEPIVRAGVHTLLAVPAREMTARPALEAVIWVMDDLASGVKLNSVNVLDLLMAHAAVCHDRLGALEHMQILAETDPLTRLRHLGPFTERLTTTQPGQTAFLVIDLDDFKHVNDILGHAEGDRLLVEVADALREALRQGDEVFRVGGDEFVAVVEVHETAEVTGIANRLMAAVSRTGISVSIGAALRGLGEPAEVTLRRADEAMYAAKSDPNSSMRLAEPAQ
jgi:diguanylate cyclase (GGDEF)-like protein